MRTFNHSCCTSTRFVTAMVSYYYPTDCEVTRDTELQEWIKEIFIHCLLKNKETGTIRTLHSLCVLWLTAVNIPINRFPRSLHHR